MPTFWRWISLRVDMKTFKWGAWAFTAILAVSVGAFTGCKKDETAGESIDRNTKNAGDSLKEAGEKTKDAMKDAADKTSDALKKAGDKLKTATNTNK